MELESLDWVVFHSSAKTKPDEYILEALQIYRKELEDERLSAILQQGEGGSYNPFDGPILPPYGAPYDEVEADVLEYLYLLIQTGLECSDKVLQSIPLHIRNTYFLSNDNSFAKKLRAVI
ncbi:hypothetical protein LCGC14_0303580 [marine sediment metagenome]|uniref:Uncharacterized protein n=1 Tax=marine sediment metagenome TaxID=412755 RepID=A0A0F9U6Y9_9ZZZZ